jgi:CheY-like chemotaxis protein
MVVPTVLASRRKGRVPTGWSCLSPEVVVEHPASPPLKSSLTLPMEPFGGLCLANKPKVLLVEDSKFLRMASERALSKAGYQVISAGDGEEALRLAFDQRPDVILLDMMLPKISGPEVLKSLKNNPATLDIPVIVLTSLSQRNEEKLLSEGAAAYFEKSTLELDKGSDRIATMVETVLVRVNYQKSVALRLRK